MTEGEEKTTAVSRVVLPKPKRPPGRPPKHGAFSGAELAVIAPMKQREILDILEGKKVTVGMGDMIPIRMLAENLAIIECVLRYFKACGLFDEENKLRQGDMKVLQAAINTSARICDMLGLTPKSRLQLGIGYIQAKRDLGSMMSEEDPQ